MTDLKAADLVVVGVSATSGSPAAVRWAVAQARFQQAAVVAVRAWRPTRPPSSTSGPPHLYAEDLAAERQREIERLQNDVQVAFGEAPLPPNLSCELIQGTAFSVLRDLSESASLVVLDAPRQIGTDSAPLLAHRLVYQAACPIVIMPPRVAEQGDSSLVASAKVFGRQALQAVGTAGRPGYRTPPPMPRSSPATPATDEDRRG